MNFFDDMKLSVKSLIPLLGMALLIIFLVGLGATQLAQLERQSSHTVEHVDPALFLQARANKAVQRLGYDVYRTLSYQTGTREEDMAQNDFNATVRTGDDLFDQAAVVDPDQAKDFFDFKSRFDAIVTELQAQQTIAGTTNGFVLGSKDTTADIDVSASVARKQIEIDRKIDAFSKSLATFGDGIAAQNKQLSLALRAASTRAIWTMIVLGAMSVIGGIAAAAWITSAKIAKPISRLADRMKALAGGDLNVVVEGQARGDEVGLMAKAVQVFKDNGVKAKALEADAERMRTEAEAERARAEADRRRVEAEQATVVSTLAENLGRLAKGDLTARIDAQFDGQYLQIKTDFNSAVHSLHDAMGAISTATGEIRGGSDEIASASDDLSRRTEQQAASVEETAAALDQITTTIRRSADGAKQAARAASDAKAGAELSGAVMSEAVTAMSEIEQSSGQINQIISVIDEIAFQTSLLALNAGVEAARAGDVGRGFAVVAQEVRALAQRSAEAAREIKVLVASSSSQVQRGVKLVGDTGRTLGAIVTKIGEIDGLVSAIAKSSQEQATSLNEVNTAVNQMDQVTQQNAAMVEQATAATMSLKSEAGELDHLVRRFQINGSGGTSTRLELAQPGRHAPARNPVAQVRKKLASFAAAGDWEEF